MRPDTFIKYRPEIDGLRALAVLPVILFHADFSLFSGGFVGVDVFFVISGYLITAIIMSDIEKGAFSLIRFYERRARRILPALFFVMACCIPFAWAWMEPTQYKDFSRSLIAVALFGSNFLFWKETGYFAPAADEKPLLHTWSLAVEEQFYVFFPLLLLLLWRFGRNRALLSIAVLAAVSLILSEITLRISLSANFYLAPTRAWELYAGSICAFALRQGDPPGAVRFGNLLSLAGLAMIAFAVFFFNENTPTPSLYALIPVAGTCLIILFSNNANWTGQLLSTWPLVWIGLISYSAYLWHQPLFAFARIRMLSEPTTALMLTLTAASFGLAYLTWRFVETPLRRRTDTSFFTQSRIFASAAAMSCVLIAIGLTFNNTSSYLKRLPAKAIYYASYLQYSDTPENQRQSRSECFLSDRRNSIDLFNTAACLRLDNHKPNYLLVGDSHAAHLSLALRETFPNVNLLQATSSGCRPFIKPVGEVKCTKLLTSIFMDFIPNNKLDGIILSGRWSKADRQDLDDTMKWLSKYVHRIILIGPTMAYTSYLAEILRDAARFGEGDIATMASRYIDPTRYPANETARQIAQKYGAEFVDIISVLCPNGKCRVISTTGEPLGFDRAHFTLSGSRTVMDLLIRSGNFKLLSSEPGNHPRPAL